MYPNRVYLDIPDYPRYRVGDDGSFWSQWTNRGTLGEWRQVFGSPDTEGYWRVTLCRGMERKCVKLHKLILEVFVGPCPLGLEGCHKDGNLRNNAVSNLEYKTHQKNIDDKVIHGTMANGERINTSKVTEQDVIEIRSYRSMSNELRTQLMAKFNLSRNSLNAIRSRKTWRHVP